jgi:hypothetical protein
LGLCAAEVPKFTTTNDSLVHNPNAYTMRFLESKCSGVCEQLQHSQAVGRERESGAELPKNPPPLLQRAVGSKNRRISCTYQNELFFRFPYVDAIRSRESCARAFFAAAASFFYSALFFLYPIGVDGQGERHMRSEA